MSHTPTPWRLEQTAHTTAPVIVGTSPFTGGERRIARVLYEVGSEDPEVWDNARKIVAAVNSHDDLLATCEWLLSLMRGSYRGAGWVVPGGTADKIADRLRASVAKARGEQS